MLFSLSLAVMPTLTLSLHAGLQRAVCASLAVQLSPAAASPKCFLGGKREILLNFYFHPAKKKSNCIKRKSSKYPETPLEQQCTFPRSGGEQSRAAPGHVLYGEICEEKSKVEEGFSLKKQQTKPIQMATSGDHVLIFI